MQQLTVLTDHSEVPWLRRLCFALKIFVELVTKFLLEDFDVIAFILQCPPCDKLISRISTFAYPFIILFLVLDGEVIGLKPESR